MGVFGNCRLCQIPGMADFLFITLIIAALFLVWKPIIEAE